MNFRLFISPNSSKFIFLLVTSILLSGCSDSTPIKIGFLGGLSGRVADLGIGGRNGAALAVEMRNASGGIDGRQLQLISEDDQQNVNVAKAALNRLIQQKVEAVIGPMTSSIAVAVTPQANAAEMLLISPTATSTALSIKNDYFMRVISSTSAYAQKSAEFHYRKQGVRRTAVIYDLSNHAYTESWLNDYRKAFENAGGQLEMVIGFESSDKTRFAEIVEPVLSSDVESLLILANSVDTALIAHQIRKHNQKLQINTSEWAATERLLELGGQWVEGVVFAQFIDRESTSQRYIDFRDLYLERFGQEPGFAGLTGFDAANVLIDALNLRQTDQSIAEFIMQQRTFTAAQSVLKFDDNGDANRKTYLTTIKNGKFQHIN